MPRRSLPSRSARGGASPQAAMWTAERIRDLGPVCSLSVAAQILQISVSMAYKLADAGDFPIPLIRVGTRYRVPTPPLIAALYLPDAPSEPSPDGGDLTTARRHASMPINKSAGPPHGATPLGD